MRINGLSVVLVLALLFGLPIFAQDADGDGILDQDDNCPTQANEGQIEICAIPCPSARDDDGTKEEDVTIDYNDDWMEKTIHIVADPVDITSARLWIYGQPYNYPGVDFVEVEDYRLRVNGVQNVIQFDVGLEFDYQTDIFHWVSFDIPSDWLITGDNTFYITEQPTPNSAWEYNNLRVGLDTDSDFDRSRWFGNGDFCQTGANCDGELMIFLEICEGVQTFLRGDADGNGVFNGLADGLYILDYQFQSGPAPLCLEAADADGDGAFNGLADGLYTLNHQFNGGPPPPAPYPTCGADPDPTTSLGCGPHPGCP